MHQEIVQEYYGKILRGSDDLKTKACCTPDSMPDHVKELLKNVHDEVLAKYYGCGLVVPELLAGKRVLDLGCGSGRDVYALAQLVGGEGDVVGVDMTPEQLDTARRHVGWHMERFGYRRANVTFLQGFIEKLGTLGLQTETFDVVISNCVVNLSIDKLAVLKGVFDLLKPGGEFYFADVYADRRLPQNVSNDPVVYGECLGGALYWNDFLRLAKQAGFGDPRLVTSRLIEITDPDVAFKVGPALFGDVSSIEAGRPAAGLWTGRDLQRWHSRSTAHFQSRRPSRHCERSRVSRLWQHLAHAAQDPFRRAFCFHRRFFFTRIFPSIVKL